MSTPSRPQIRAGGSSRNPEYNVAASRPHFKREDGKRLPPVSQLNTHSGRVLARQPPVLTSYTEDQPLSIISGQRQRRRRALSAGATPGPERRIVESCPIAPSKQQALALDKYKTKPLPPLPTGNPDMTDRDRLTSQRPRTELSQLLGMTRTSSYKGTRRPSTSSDRPSSVAPSEFSLSLVCPECKQSDSCKAIGQTFNGDICKTCKRFVPTSTLTALESATPMTEKPNPLPPSKYPYGPVCRTCLSVPGYIYQEYLQFFPACDVCGHLSDMLLQELIAKEGNITPLHDDSGFSIFKPSKELQDWCAYVAHEAHGLGRHVSKKSMASSISSTASAKLRRSNAVKRTPTGSTASSTFSKAGLVPVAEIVQRNVPRPVLTRRFSFDELSQRQPGQAQMAPATPRKAYPQTPLPSPSKTPQGDAFDSEPPNHNRGSSASYESVPLDTPTPRTQHSQRDLTLPGASKTLVSRPVIKTTFSEILGDQAPRKNEELEEDPVMPEQDRPLRRQPSIQSLLPRFLQDRIFSTAEKYEDE